MSNMKFDSWIQTDENQLVKYLGNSNDLYRFKVINCNPLTNVDIEEVSVCMLDLLIDFNEFNTKDIDSYLKPYGYDSINHVKDLYGDSYAQIIAECISEVETLGARTSKFIGDEQTIKVKLDPKYIEEEFYIDDEFINTYIIENF